MNKQTKFQKRICTLRGNQNLKTIRKIGRKCGLNHEEVERVLKRLGTDSHLKPLGFDMFGRPIFNIRCSEGVN